MTKTINEKLSAIQIGLKVKKSSFNSFGKYYFRNAESILEALKPLLKTQNCTVTLNEELILSDPPILSSTATISDGTKEISAVAVVGVDMMQKGMQVPQKFGSASSYGKKYALGNLFLIDDTADADASNTHGKNVQLQPQAQPAATKVSIKQGDDAFKKAKDYIKAGGSIEAIKTKYVMTADVEKALKDA